MSSFTSILGLSKRARKEKPSVESNGERNVTVVRTIHDVHMPAANEDTEQSLVRYQSTGGLRKIATSAGDLEITTMRLSQSENAVHRMALHRSASEELVFNRKRTLPKLETGRSEHASDRESQQLDVVSAVLPAGEDASSSNFPTSAVSPLSLEMPVMGPTFGVEMFLPEAQTETDIGNLSETSASTSSSPEMWEENTRCPSSASSNSTLRSDFVTETSSSDTKPLQCPSIPPKSEKRIVNSSKKKNSP